MDIEGVSSKTAMVINQVTNLLIAIGIAVYYYDGFTDVALGTVVGFALLNSWDAVFVWVLSKIKKDEE